MTAFPELWTKKEIAEYLRKSPDTVIRHTAKEPGFPEPVRGSQKPLLFRKDEVLAWINREAMRSPKL